MRTKSKRSGQAFVTVRDLSQEGKMLTRGSGETGGISLIIKGSLVSVFVRRRLLYIP